MNTQFLERAMLITGGFEGSDPWANITGNFDGEGLTCGQLGKTIKAGDQQAVVKNYIKAHGTAELLALMPKKGGEYVKVINASIANGMAIVVKWSDKHGRVLEPYKSELAAFWKSAKMVVKQREHAEAHEGALTDTWVKDWKGNGSFQEFALFFDVAAQNGSLKGVTAAVVDAYIGTSPAAAVAKALLWVDSCPKKTSGYADAKKNVPLWRGILASAELQIIRLFIFAILRAQKALPAWQWDVANRKGTLAVGEGWVHGSKWSFLDKFDLVAPPAIPVIEEVPAAKPVAPPVGAAPAGAGALFRIAANSGLWLRSSPDSAGNKNKIAAYAQGTLVRFVRESAKKDWWEVSVDEGGKTRTGFMAAGLLSPVASVVAPNPAPVSPAAPPPPPPATAAGVVEVHFPNPNNRPVKRAETSGRIWKLNEPGAPLRSGNTPAKRAAELAAVIAWLNPEKSVRHLPDSKNTYCNIYAYDYACLAQCYIPRVWWTQKGIHELTLGHTVVIKYEDTVDELTANMLYQWFRDWGGQFGWTAAHDLDELQSSANTGGVSIIVAKNSQGHGHITAVVPEIPGKQAKRDAAGHVVVPLESQAGSTNHNYVTKASAWWKSPKYTTGFWVHA
ncbi:hypothetical protein [Prosthecobacter sp.]|uniref:hypothetical protein n=1 Tax=Prosthecobacter sp. TaxID=1965333 RepID=UPI002ABC2D05|nr:hypothetical protein [Prosthecobacter sp.]MDZ4403002.1 hypothetical protein [Prosthecobacter sp.]